MIGTMAHLQAKGCGLWGSSPVVGLHNSLRLELLRMGGGEYILIETTGIAGPDMNELVLGNFGHRPAPKPSTPTRIQQ